MRHGQELAASSSCCAQGPKPVAAVHGGRRGQRPQAAAAGPPAAMRRRAAGLLRQAAAGLAAAGRSSVGSAGPGRRPTIAAAFPGGNGSNPSPGGSWGGPRPASFGSQAGGRAGGSPQPPPSSPPPPPAAAGSGQAPIAEQLAAAGVRQAAPAGLSPQQRAALQAAVAAKMAAVLDFLGGNRNLWGLRSQAGLLSKLGISADELQTRVLTKVGTGPEALNQLAALTAAKQAAVMQGGEEHMGGHLHEQREQQPGQGPAQQQQQAGGYSPAWRQQRQAQDAQQQQQQQQRQQEEQQQAPAAGAAPAAAAAAGAPAPTQRAPWQRQPSASAPPPPPQQQQQQPWQPGGRGAGAPPAWPQQQAQQGQRQPYQGQGGKGRGQQQQQEPLPRASIRDLLNERRIRLPQYSPGSYNHLMCPECLGGDKGEKSLSVTIEEGSENAVWNCFRAKCGWTGGVNTRQGINRAYRQFTNDSGFAVTAMRKRKEESPLRPNPSFDAELSPQVLEFFAARGISAATLERNRVAQETLADGSVAIAFPYYRDGQLVNIKYRSLNKKKFWQVKGAEKILYGLDDIVGSPDIVVVEGEMDKLALEEAGVTNVVSVPDGAPARVKEGDVPPADQDTKFSYLWNCRAWLDAASKVVIATDNDAPGDALSEELARRLGRERCWRVRWPLNEEDHQYVAELAGVQYVQYQADGTAAAAAADGDAARQSEQQAGNGGAALGPAAVLPGDGAQAAAARQQGPAGLAGGTAEALQLAVEPGYYRKDANEVLMKDGPAMLKAFLDGAEPFPIRGLLRFHEYYDDIIKNYRLEHKDGQGRSTGWPSLDAFYKVIPGELTIVTGVPNSGKSEWIDALLANLSEQHDWCFALCSMEKKATDHARQLVEKYIGKPFFDLPYARGVRRMSERELDEGLDWIDDRFHLVRYEDDALPAVDWVLDVARAAVYRYGIRGLVIDPYNELDHQRPASMNETEYVSQMLTKVKRFAQTTGVHVWFVAHPRQLREWKGQAPNLYDISGSAHFINKADNGIVVHRDRDPDSPDQHKVHILVRKVRNKAAGTIGDCTLEYERVNGRYIDPEHPDGGPRTAQRVNFDAQQRQERLAALRAEEQQAAVMAALQAELDDAALVASGRGGVAGGAAVAAGGMPAVQVAVLPDGGLNGDPLTEEQEAAAWMEGGGGAL